MSHRSPVDELLAAQRADKGGRSLLDSAPAGGRVSGWWWFLPLTFLLPGGIIAFFAVRATNRTVAWWMLAVGVVGTALTIASIGPTARLLGYAGSVLNP